MYSIHHFYSLLNYVITAKTIKNRLILKTLNLNIDYIVVLSHIK
ncbi:hypothetical protein STAPHY8AQ_20081 [Staphylococcus sp. 8AQ]|nr:hypothetical protein STAPHY8AQ_20081 [Staphylococcus sp. 8AQ]